ncbi:MerR family transcriptional regulator, partial [Candidatus Microgenomates bacterium]|nr:MerR family transcriptional regulator [Candidatus Microgenomates bacterium]
MSLPATFYFSVNQAAKIIATSSKTLRRLVKKGVVKPERGSKGELFFTFDDLVLLQNALSHSREERTYSVTQATRLLKVSPDTLRRWEEEGKIKPTRTPGGHRRYTASQLTKLTAIKEAKREVKIPVAIPPRVEPLISSLLPSIGEIPPLYQELHPTQTRALGVVAVVVGLVGMVFVAEKGLSLSKYIQVQQVKTVPSPTRVLQAATEARQVSFNVNVESANRENATFDKDVDV